MEIPTRRPGRCLFRALVPAAVVAQTAGEEMPAAYPVDAVLVRAKDRGRGQVTVDSVPAQAEGMEAQAPVMADPGRENRAVESAKLSWDATME